MTGRSTHILLSALTLMTASPAVVWAQTPGDAPERSVVVALPAQPPADDIASGEPGPVAVRGATGLTLHWLARSIPTEIAGLTIDDWVPVCAVPCIFVPDREGPQVYGLSRGGDVQRADAPPILWGDEAALAVSFVDRSDLRILGAILLVVLPVLGLGVTLVPSFVHVEPDVAVSTTVGGSGLVLVGTVVGLSLVFQGDGARVTLE